MSFRLKPLIIALACILAAPAAFATNGYNGHGIGTKNKGMAGAGMALPEDAISMANNPASLTEIEDGWDFSASVFSPERKYQASESLLNGNFGAFTLGPDKQTSARNYFVIPSIAGKWQIDDASAWGFAFYGRGGMNTTWDRGSATYDPDGPGPAGPMTFPGVYGGGAPTSINLMQALLDLSYSRNVGENTSIGGAIILAGQQFEARGLNSFLGFTNTFNASGGTEFPTNLTDNGASYSYGYGLKVGFHSNLSDNFSLAASYTTKLSMTEFDEYADLFAEDGGFDIPATLRAGISFKTGAAAYSFDIEHTWYSDVTAIGNPMSNLFDCPAVAGPTGDVESCLGGKRGGGFGWDDVTTYKFGGQWKGDGITYRAGYSYTDQPVQDADITFNILAPGIIEHHFTFGFTKPLANERDWSMAFMYAPENSIKAPNGFDPTQDITIAMSQWEVEFSYSW